MSKNNNFYYNVVKCAIKFVLILPDIKIVVTIFKK